MTRRSVALLVAVVAILGLSVVTAAPARAADPDPTVG